MNPSSSGSALAESALSVSVVSESLLPSVYCHSPHSVFVHHPPATVGSNSSPQIGHSTDCFVLASDIVLHERLYRGEIKHFPRYSSVIMTVSRSERSTSGSAARTGIPP